MKIIFHISYYWLIHKFQDFVKLWLLQLKKISKTQLHKIGQSERFLGRLLGLSLKTGLPLIGKVLKPLDKRVLILLGLTAASSVTNAAIQKKIYG